MKKFLNVLLLVGAVATVSACSCVKTTSYGSRQTAGAMPTNYGSDCVTADTSGSARGDGVFKSKQNK
jgi:hypothetical protein